MPGRRRLRLALALVALAAGPAAAESLSREARWLADYLRIDTSNPPGNEAAAAAYLAAILRHAGLASERQVTATGRTSLAALLPATVPGAPTVVLLHHLDVVPAGEGWSVDPFAAEVREGFLYGRGAIDSKSLGIAHLAALVDAARLPERRRNLLYLAVADEENGGGEGMAWLVERRPELFADVEAALGEGGLNRTVLGRTFYWGIEVAQKRAYWLELEAGGRAGHGSSLNPESAAHELVRALERVLARPPVWKLQPPVAEFFRALVRSDPSLRSARGRAEEAVGTSGPARWVPPGFWGLLLDTVQVTTLDAGERPNVVPPRARAGLDVRLLPQTDAEAFLAELEATLGDRVAVEVRLATPPAPSSPVGNATWRALEAALGDEAPLVPALIPGITDARFLRQRGIPAYGVSPFALEGLLVRRVHGFDEGIPLDVFDRGVERMLRIVRALVAP